MGRTVQRKIGEGQPRLLELLRDWWLVCRSRGWLFPGRDPLQPMTTADTIPSCRSSEPTQAQLFISDLLAYFRCHEAPAVFDLPDWRTGRPRRKLF